MKIAFSAEFDPEKTAFCGQCFRCEKTEDGRVRYLCRDRWVHVAKTKDYLEADCSERDWREIWNLYFDGDRNYAAIRESIPPGDTYMRNAAREGAGIRILRQDPWETLVTFIISQRKTLPAIRGCVEKLASRYGNPMREGEKALYAFPEAGELARLSVGELQACGLGYRAAYVADAAQKVASGEILLEKLEVLPDPLLIDKLKTIKGVGDKVANCVALFAYGRTALAPVDVWIKRVIDNEYEGRNPFLQYGNAAGIMQQYVFYYMQQHKK